MLLNQDVIGAVKENVAHTVKEQEKQGREGKPASVEEDDPATFQQAGYRPWNCLLSWKLKGKRKREREAKEMHERKMTRRRERDTHTKKSPRMAEKPIGKPGWWSGQVEKFPSKYKREVGEKAWTFLRPPKLRTVRVTSRTTADPSPAVTSCFKVLFFLHHHSTPQRRAVYAF